MNNKKGFTLIELLVVVLIIGILAAMAIPQYFKAVERSRMGEAVTLLANIAQAQQRKYLQINKYTTKFQGLDVTPKGAKEDVYYTKGDPVQGTGGNGFKISLGKSTDEEKKYDEGVATATRYSQTGTLQYAYTLRRYYAGVGTACTGQLVKTNGTTEDDTASGGTAATDDAKANGAALCADFCGLDELSKKWCCSDGSGENDDPTKLSGACTKPSATDVGAAAAPANP